jgi:hypothetical protein
MDLNEPASQPSSDPEFVSARARRRRAQRRAYFPTDEEARASLFAHLTRRAYPSYEFFIFSLLAGVILGAGYFVNAQALLIFGILVAPLITPWIGLQLATIAGTGRFFLQMLAALLVASLLIFISGILAGFASRTFGPLNFNEAFTHSLLWWPDFIALSIGAVVLTISFVRSEERPYLPSALVAYEFFLPLCAAGFGLGSGVGEGGIWPQGLFVFLAHFSWATLLSIVTLFLLRFYPTNLNGTVLTGVVLVGIIGAVSSLTGVAQWIGIQTGLAAPEPAPPTQPIPTLSLIPTMTSSPNPDATTAFIGVPTQTPSQTPRPTVQVTLPPTETATSTVTAEPTPIIGQIRAAEGGGAFIRERPGGIVLATLGNGSTVTIIPNDLQEVNGVIWVHVFTVVNDVRVEGWMIQAVLVTATPVAEWQPSPTP